MQKEATFSAAGAFVTKQILQFLFNVLVLF